MTAGPVAGLVLAAGASARFGGRNKLLAALPDGRPMVLHSVALMLAGGVAPVTVVLGHQAAEVAAALAPLGDAVRTVMAAEAAEGMGASLRAGMAGLPAETEAVLIGLGDMPLVEPGMITALVAAFHADPGTDIVVPVHAGQMGHPRLFGRAHFSALRALAGDEGARGLIAAHPARVRHVAAPSPAVLQDADTEAAFADLFQAARTLPPIGSARTGTPVIE